MTYGLRKETSIHAGTKITKKKINHPKEIVTPSIAGVRLGLLCSQGTCLQGA
jgi:hypothetical protein